MGNKHRFSNQYYQGCNHDFERYSVLVVGINPWVSVLPVRMLVLGVAIRVHKMRDCANLKEKGNKVNQPPHGGPNPNSPKRNHLYVLGAKEGTNVT